MNWIKSLIACSFFLTYSQIGLAVGLHGSANDADVTTHFQSDDSEAESLWSRMGQGTLLANAGKSCSIYGRIDSQGKAIALDIDSSLNGYHHTKLTIPESMLPLKNGRKETEAEYGATLVEKWAYQDGKLLYTADTPNGDNNHRNHVSIILYTNPGLTRINGFEYKSESQSADWNGSFSSNKGFFASMGDLAAHTPFISAFVGNRPIEYAPVSWSCLGNFQIKSGSN